MLACLPCATTLHTSLVSITSKNLRFIPTKRLFPSRVVNCPPFAITSPRSHFLTHQILQPGNAVCNIHEHMQPQPQPSGHREPLSIAMCFLFLAMWLCSLQSREKRGPRQRMTPFRLGYRVRSTHSRTILSHVTTVTLAPDGNKTGDRPESSRPWLLYLS